VSGKFNSDFVISQFEKNIHTSKHQPKGLGFLAPKFQALKSERLVEVIKKREQNHLIVGFLGTRVSDLERYDLRVLLTVLGGQSGRLFREIRDRQGLCYTVAPISFEGIEPGYVGVYIGCDPKKREQALKAIRIELDKLVSKPITSLELERAKQFVLGRYHMDMQLNSSIASSQAFNTLYGLGHNEHTKIADGIRRVSIKSIYNLSQKLFSAPSVTALIV
jgi:zinc protease